MHRAACACHGASLMHPTMSELGDRAGQNRRTVFARPQQTQRVSAKVWGMERPRIYGAPCRGILPRMTRHKHAQTGLVTPQLPQHWLTAALRAFAMLVLHVASTLQMIRRREPVNATQTMPTDLPRTKTDTHQETTAAQQSSPTTPSVSLGSRQAIHLPSFQLVEATRAPSLATKGNCLHLCEALGEVDRRVFAARRRGRKPNSPSPLEARTPFTRSRRRP